MINKALYILIAILFFSPVFGKEKVLPETTEVIALTQLDTTLLNELLDGAHPDIAVECKEGTTIPVQFLQNTGLFGVELAPNLTIKVQKTCYLRVIKKSGYVSFDLDSWESAKHFFSGKPKVNLKINMENQSLLVESDLIPSPQIEDEDDEEN
ncbi:MAG: hypothetical protein K940chlam6_00059 [Chlamydiae bacterium]|nr:hypothetical protein [Chlamydiota bacterium]